VLVATVMTASLVSIAHTTSRIIDAQRAQFAADAVAIDCVLTNSISAQLTAQEIATQNHGEILELDSVRGRCAVVVKSHSVARGAVAVSSSGFDLPTLQR
jgi:hypothetical protein